MVLVCQNSLDIEQLHMWSFILYFLPFPPIPFLWMVAISKPLIQIYDYYLLLQFLQSYHLINSPPSRWSKVTFFFSSSPLLLKLRDLTSQSLFPLSRLLLQSSFGSLSALPVGVWLNVTFSEKLSLGSQSESSFFCYSPSTKLLFSLISLTPFIIVYLVNYSVRIGLFLLKKQSNETERSPHRQVPWQIRIPITNTNLRNICYFVRDYNE